MGNQPIPPRTIRPPDRESFHLGVAKRAYVSGDLTIEEFEQSVAHVIGGGTLNQRGRVPTEGIFVQYPLENR